MRPTLRRVRASALLVLPIVLAASGPSHADIPADLSVQPFASGFASPVAVRHAADGTGRLYVVEQGGRVIALSRTGARLGTVLDLVASPPPHGFISGGERGLLGLAFHPQYPTVPQAFVYYTDGNGHSVVARYLLDNSGAAPVATAPQVVLRVEQDFSNHNGGDLHFGPHDGYLYIGLGDGGSGGDPCGRAQTLDPADLQTAGASCSPNAGFSGDSPDSLALLGKMLRIDVDGSTAAGANGLCGGNADGSAAYAIPPGNPFAGNGTSNGCDEVWHYGLRNPFRFSFDRATGDLFIGDVGQDQWEEISFSTASQPGLNFGWNLCEGDHAFPLGSATCPAAGTTPPILEYPNGSTNNCAVSGGFRYRGPIVPLRGDYIYADFCSGRIFVAEESAGSWTAVQWQESGLMVSGFGEGEDGTLYLTEFTGNRVMQFVSAETELIFADGFED